MPTYAYNTSTWKLLGFRLGFQQTLFLCNPWLSPCLWVTGALHSSCLATRFLLTIFLSLTHIFQDNLNPIECGVARPRSGKHISHRYIELTGHIDLWARSDTRYHGMDWMLQRGIKKICQPPLVHDRRLRFQLWFVQAPFAMLVV